MLCTLLCDIKYSNTNNFHTYMRYRYDPKVVLLQVKIDLGVMAMNVYSAHPRSQELESHARMQFIFIARTFLCSFVVFFLFFFVRDVLNA